jgi:hypothetical protein
MATSQDTENKIYVITGLYDICQDIANSIYTLLESKKKNSEEGIYGRETFLDELNFSAMIVDNGLANLVNGFLTRIFPQEAKINLRYNGVIVVEAKKGIKSDATMTEEVQGPSEGIKAAIKGGKLLSGSLDLGATIYKEVETVKKGPLIKGTLDKEAL